MNQKNLILLIKDRNLFEIQHGKFQQQHVFLVSSFNFILIFRLSDLYRLNTLDMGLYLFLIKLQFGTN